MRELSSRLFPAYLYTDPLERRRAIGTYFIAGIMLIGVALSGLVGIVALLTGRSASIDLPLLVRGAVVLVVAFAAIILTRRQQQTYAALVLLLAWFTLAVTLMLFGAATTAVSLASFLVGISLGALLVGDWTTLYTTSFSALFMFLNTWLNAHEPGDPWGTLFFALLPILLVHGGVNYALAQGLRGVAQQIAADVEARGLRLAGASGTIAQQLLAARLDLNILLRETVKLVRDTFPDVDEAQLFLVEKDRRNATLVATTSKAGQAWMGQQIGVGSLHLIGRVTIGGQLALVRDTGEEKPFRRSAFLEGTRAELALPLRVGTETIGALDLQSRNVDAFSPEEVEALSTLTNLIAITIDNARLYAEAQEKLAENQRLYEQTSASLHEIERLNQQLTGAAWAEYLRGMKTQPAFTVDPGTGRVEDAAEWTVTMGEVSRRNQAVIRGNAQVKILALPISVRGQVIGAMEFELAPDQHVGPEQMVILQQVVERLGLAAENIRLLDEAQRIAQREAMVNEITARMQAATSVEAVIAAATQSLADAFQAPRVAIRLGTPDGANGLDGKAGQARRARQRGQDGHV